MFLAAGRVAVPKGELCSLESTNEEILHFPELRPASNHPLYSPVLSRASTINCVTKQGYERNTCRRFFPFSYVSRNAGGRKESW
jgi:hypothetical protein